MTNHNSQILATSSPAVVLVIFLYIVLPSSSKSIGDDWQKFALKSKISTAQPMTGIVFWAGNPKATENREAIALEYRYCGYNEVVGADGQYDWTPIENALDQIAKRNHQAILRFHFCYVGKKTTVPECIRKREDYRERVGMSEKKKTYFCDWSNQSLQEFTLDFYSRFARRYDNDPRLAFLQTGFGLWAEYHIYSGPRKLGQTFPTKEFQALFLKHLHRQFKSLPWSISIDAADSTYSPIQEDRELLSLGFGLFDDSFLCKDHKKVNEKNWRILDRNRWKRQPAGGEFNYYSDNDQQNALDANGPHGVSFEDSARQFHITYMIGNDQPQFRPIQQIKKAGHFTGYRFRVTEAKVKSGEVRLKVINEGVAPIYRDAYFSIGKRQSKTSLRGLLPGKTITCRITEISDTDPGLVRIQSPAILPSQQIQFEADLQ